MKIKTNFNKLYLIAEDQAGYFTTSQAHDAGYSRERLSDLASRGQFERILHGIYRLSHFPNTRFEDLHVASLRTGPDSVVSHDSALAVYGLSDVLPSKTHIIMPRSGSRRRKGIQLHTHNIQEDEITEREGLRVTTVERTIADVIAGGISYQHIQQAITEAIQRGLTTKERLVKQADRHGGRVAKYILQILKEEL